MKKRSDIYVSFVKKMPVIIVLSILLIMPLVTVVSADTYESVDLNYDTVYTSSEHDFRDPVCWGDNVAYFQGDINQSNFILENITLKVWKKGAGTSSIPISNFNSVSISKDYVVFEDTGQGSSDRDIYYASISGGTPHKLVDTTDDSWYPVIDGSNVVFETDNAPLRVKSIGGSVDVELPMATSAYYDISGSNVVYDGRDTDGNLGIYLYNITTETNTRLADYDGGCGLKISGGRVVYGVVSNFGKTVSLYLLDINTGAQTRIYTTDYGMGEFDIDGNFVVFGNYIYDIQAQTTKMVAGAGNDDISAGGGSFAWYYEGDTTVVYEIRHAQFPEPGPAPPSEEPTTPPSDATHVLIGPNGGEIYVDDFHLQVYKDSLGENISFYIIKPIVNNSNILKPFEIQPAGINFNPPAQISINISGTRGASSDYDLLYLSDDEWRPVAGASLSADSTSIIGTITSTGTYALSKAMQSASQVIDSTGGVVSIPDVSLEVPADALSSSATVAVNEVFMESADIAQAVSVDLGGTVLSAPAKLTFDPPAGVDSSKAQVEKLVNGAWVKVDSTVNSAGQIVADITEEGIYALTSTSSSGGGLSLPCGMDVMAVLLPLGLGVTVIRRKKYHR